MDTIQRATGCSRAKTAKIPKREITSPQARVLCVFSVFRKRLRRESIRVHRRCFETPQTMVHSRLDKSQDAFDRDWRYENFRHCRE